jgi:hypothetical protein
MPVIAMIDTGGGHGRLASSFWADIVRYRRAGSPIDPSSGREADANPGTHAAPAFADFEPSAV